VRAQASFHYRGHEGLAFFMPGLYPLLESPALVLLNRRGQDGQSIQDVRAEVGTWLTQLVRHPLRSNQLLVPRLQLEGLLDPLPRSRRRAHLLASQPMALWRLGMARGAAVVQGFPEDLWKKITATDTATVDALIRKRFRAKEATFVALTPRPKK